MLVGTRNGPRRSANTLALGIALSAAAWLTTPLPAYACSFVLPCPASRTLPDHGGRLPANLRGFLWRPPCKGSPADHKAELKAITPDGVSQALTVTMTPFTKPGLQYVHWDDELQEGTQLVFSYDDPNPARATGANADDPDAGLRAVRRSVELFVTRAAPIPQKLGGLWSTVAYGSFPLESVDGDCSHLLQASYVDLEILPSYDAEPFSDALYYETRVDDTPWRAYRESLSMTLHEWLGGSALGRDRDRVYLPCALPNHSPAMFAEIADILAPGHHSIRGVGYLPDGTALESDAFELELVCPDTSHASAGDGGAPPITKPQRASAEMPAADGGGCNVVEPGARPHTTAFVLSWLCLLGLQTAMRRRTGAP